VGSIQGPNDLAQTVSYQSTKLKLIQPASFSASHTSKASMHIEDVMPWATATRILHAYHDYL
jgi:hypothetical protein